MTFWVVPLFLFGSLSLSAKPARVPILHVQRVFEPRIEKLTGVEKIVVGKVPLAKVQLPLYALRTNGPGKKNVLLSAGVHGDEPAGVDAVLQFLENEASKYTDEFRFYVFPCVNPAGYLTDTAENAAGQNVNRSFKKKASVREAALVQKQLAAWNEKFVFSIDMHEIPAYWEGEGFKKQDNPTTAYLYETQADKSKRIGPAMIAALPKTTEVCTWPKIYGDVAVNGVVTYPEGNLNKVYAEQTTLDGYVHGRFTSHTFTTETPLGWPMQKRVDTHLIWLRTALQKYSDRPKGE